MRREFEPGEQVASPSRQPLPSDRRLAGIGLMLMACVLFTGIDSSAKWLINSGLPPLEVVAVRYAAHMLMVTAFFLPTRGVGLVRTSQPVIEVLRALFLLFGTIFNFFAVRYLPLTLTSAIMFTSPLWVCALSVPLLGERVGSRRLAAVIIGFCGVVIAMRPWSAEAHWAVLLSMATAVCIALYSITTRQLAGRDSAATQQFYAATLATVAIVPFALVGWLWPASAADWWAFALIGVFGWAGHQAMIIAHRFAPATTLAPFFYIQIVYMGLASWLVFDEPPGVWLTIGAGIVLASGLYVWLRERQLSRIER